MRLADRVCHGNGPDHCCYVDGEVCLFLRENVTLGRRWSCGLFNAYGNWPQVHTDPGYVKHVQPQWDLVGIESCGAWREQQCCFAETGVTL